MKGSNGEENADSTNITKCLLSYTSSTKMSGFAHFFSLHRNINA